MAAAVLTAVALLALARAPAAAGGPTPTPVPLYSSKITVTYTYQGVPMITAVQSLGVAYVEGEPCEGGGPQVVYETIVNETLWPWRDYEPCNSVGVKVRVCNGPSVCSEEFTFEGEDVAVDIPIDEVEGVALATARFVHDGVSQDVSVIGWKYEVGSQICSAGPTSAVFVPPAKVSVVTRFWPSAPSCLGSPATVSFNTLEFGVLEASFDWSGESVEFNVDTGAFAQTPTPSPGPSPTPTASPMAAQLPRSGGSPDTGDWPAKELLWALIAVAAGIAGLSTVTARRK